jgi:hypothetical protein
MRHVPGRSWRCSPSLPAALMSAQPALTGDTMPAAVSRGQPGSGGICRDDRRPSAAYLFGKCREDFLRPAKDREVALATVDPELCARNRLGIAARVLDRDRGVGIPVVD